MVRELKTKNCLEVDVSFRFIWPYRGLMMSIWIVGIFFGRLVLVNRVSIKSMARAQLISKAFGAASNWSGVQSSLCWSSSQRRRG